MKEFAYCANCGQRFAATGGRAHCEDCSPSAELEPEIIPSPGSSSKTKLPGAPRPKTRTNLPTARPGTRTNLPTARPGTRTNLPTARPGTRTNLPTARPGTKTIRPGTKTNLPTARPGSRTNLPKSAGKSTRSIPQARPDTVRSTRTVPEEKSSGMKPWLIAGGFLVALVGIVIGVASSGSGTVAPPPPPKPVAKAPPPAAAPPAAPVAAAPVPAPAPPPKTAAPAPVAPRPAPPKSRSKEKGPAQVAEEAVKAARDFEAASPNDVEGQIRAWEKAVRLSALTPHFDDAKKGRAAVLARGRGGLEEKMVALDERAKPAREREEFQAARTVYDEARNQSSHPEWGTMIGKKIQELRATAQKLLDDEIKHKASQAKSGGDMKLVGELTDRVARWGYPELSDDLKRHLSRVLAGGGAAAKAAPKPKPKAKAKAKSKPKPKSAPAAKTAKPKPAPAGRAAGAFLADDGLAGAGMYRKKEYAGVGSAWTVASDYGKGTENHVSFAFDAEEGATYRCWAYIGACCDETFSVACQATGLEGEDPTRKGKMVKADPGAPEALPIDVDVKGVKAEHVDHGGPKTPAKWVWIEVPLAKTAAAGAREVRIISLQKGFSVAAVYVSSTATEPPASLDALKK